MNTTALDPTPAAARPRPMSTATGLRLLLIVGCACAVAGVLARVEPSVLLGDDPGLAQLLRGMAVIKATLVVATLAVLSWRFGHPVDRRIAAGYLVGAVLIAAATAAIWQLAYIMPAAAAFHLGGFMLLVLAARDDASPLARRLRRTR